MRNVLSLALCLAFSSPAAAADDCNFLQGSSLRWEADQIVTHVTPQALVTLSQQYYPQGFLNSLLQQSCSIGEPLSSQLSFILATVTSTAEKHDALSIVIQNDEQLIPYTYENRVATVWVQGVAKKIPLPTSSKRTTAAVKSDGYATIDTSLSEVIGSAYFAVAQISEKDSVYALNRILKAESRFESGVLYRLTLELSIQDTVEVHEIIVLSQPWIHSWKLIADSRIQPRS